MSSARGTVDTEITFVERTSYGQATPIQDVRVDHRRGPRVLSAYEPGGPVDEGGLCSAHRLRIRIRLSKHTHHAAVPRSSRRPAGRSLSFRRGRPSCRARGRVRTRCPHPYRGRPANTSKDALTCDDQPFAVRGDGLKNASGRDRIFLCSWTCPAGPGTHNYREVMCRSMPQKY